MSQFDDYSKVELARQLREEFEKEKNDANGEAPKSIQRYSESTKTLYADEEMALKKIYNIAPVFEEEKKKELSMDEMLEMLHDEQESKKKPVRRGYAKIEAEEGKWHTSNRR